MTTVTLGPRLDSKRIKGIFLHVFLPNPNPNLTLTTKMLEKIEKMNEKKREKKLQIEPAVHAHKAGPEPASQ
jgi:hypothetical protein